MCERENQDTYRIARNGDICVVCDGMGGAAGGRLASTLASETYAAEMEKALKPDMTPEQLREASAYAVAMANRAVAERQRRRRRFANMGTTLVAAVAYENGVVITNGRQPGGA
ncbi:MAG: PP2C family protein-serine/threonine phosphatase, partial [Dysosmobacter sp.]